MTVSANRLELLQIADAVAREKQIDREVVIEAMEDAIQRAARSRYGQENDIRAFIERKTGRITLNRVREVVETIEDEHLHISLDDARLKNPAAEVGDFIADELPPIDFGRIAAQSAKQVIVQKVRDAERERQYEEFKDRVGDIVHGLVKRVEYGNVVVDLGRAEAIIRRDELIPHETFHNGDRVRAYVYDVRREVRGPQIFLSRTHPQFMARLFSQEVPEVYEGIIDIKSIARDPGSRAKIAVVSHESSIDPIGACVGMRGSRVQAVVGELQGEKIDIINWSPDPATFIVNALAPAEVAKVVLDEDAERVEVVVPDDQLSLAIGRRGQNVRLASQVTGWGVDILTEAEESERRQKEFRERTALFVDELDVDEMIAQLLASEGFTSVEEVAYVDASELLEIEAFDEDTAEELQRRARERLAALDAQHDARRKELGVDDAVTDVAGLTPAMVAALGEKGIRTLEDVAWLESDELTGGWDVIAGERKRVDGALESFDLTTDEANAIILDARVRAGLIEPEPELESEAEPESEFESELAPEAEGAEAEDVIAEGAVAEGAVAEDAMAEDAVAEEGGETAADPDADGDAERNAAAFDDAGAAAGAADEAAREGS